MTTEPRAVLQQALYDALCYWGTLPEPEGDVPERYHKWDDLGEIADKLLEAVPSPSERERIAAWLRGDVPTDYTDPQFDIGMNLADAIERGEYMKGRS